MVYKYETEINRLRKEENRLIDKFETLDPLSDEYRKIQQRVLEIHTAINEYLSVDVSNKKAGLENENREAEHKEERLKTFINLGLGIAGLAVPIIFNCYWMANGFKFEETGSFSSKTFNWLINNQFKRK